MRTLSQNLKEGMTIVYDGDFKKIIDIGMFRDIANEVDYVRIITEDSRRDSSKIIYKEFNRLFEVLD